MPRPAHPRRSLSAAAAAAAALLLAALTLTACGRSGYGTVNTHQLVLIPTALPASPAARRAEVQLICAARAEAHALHHTLTVARPRNASASAQIAVANQVTADKPGGVLIIPVAANPMLAPILSMRRAGIKVVRLAGPIAPRTAAAQGARAVVRAVSAIEHANVQDNGNSRAISLPARCESVH
jgi:ABC-type sugar transport system substrate-binding protein